MALMGNATKKAESYLTLRLETRGVVNITTFNYLKNLWYIADTCNVLKAQAMTFGHKKGRAKWPCLLK